MAKIYPFAYMGDQVIPFEQANLSVASSAVLYGLSVYTVFPLHKTADLSAGGPATGRQGSGHLAAFRLHDHYQRLVNSARIIGLDTFERDWTEAKFVEAARATVVANVGRIDGDAFVRATVHAVDMVAGTKSRGVTTQLSIFIYEAAAILPQTGARLKTSVWRRTPDYSIPSRAKVNGAYVNSVLAKQDAIDSGYDDCVLLDAAGHVCELSAANIFIVRGGRLVTPGHSTDLLEGINRRTVLELAAKLGLEVEERDIDLTELYIADEAFACGTSAYIAPIIEVDKRVVGDGKVGPITTQIQKLHREILHGENPEFASYITLF